MRVRVPPAAHTIYSFKPCIMTRQQLIDYILDNTTWKLEELETYTDEQVAKLAADIEEGYRLLKQGTYGRES